MKRTTTSKSRRSFEVVFEESNTCVATSPKRKVLVNTNIKFLEVKSHKHKQPAEKPLNYYEQAPGKHNKITHKEFNQRNKKPKATGIINDPPYQSIAHIS